MSAALDLRLRAGFAAAFGGVPDCVVRAPGRVNLIGEHTDYNDGFVLPAAIGVETRVAWRRTSERAIDVVALDFAEERDTIALDAPVARAAGWRLYVRAMVDRMRADGYAVPGLELAIAGSIPRGSGLSSSASLEVALGFVMSRAAGVTPTTTALAQAAQAAENGFVGMRCGIMDQLASAAGRRDAALLIDCRSLEATPVPIPPGWSVMIVQSGVRRGLVEGHYNRRRQECEQAAAALGAASLRDVDGDRLEHGRAAMPEVAYRRARHVVSENARTLAAADALGCADLPAIGALMAASHASMRDDFEITVPPIDALAAGIAASLDGRGGARMTGGGFGGAVVALMAADDVPRVKDDIVRTYRTPDGDAPEIMIEQACDGVGDVSASGSDE